MRESTALPGTLQIRVTADKQDTEDVSRKLGNFLKSNGYSIVSQSTDFQDKADAGRAIFHVMAVPKVPQEDIHGTNGTN